MLQVETATVTGESAVDFTWLFIKMLLILGIVCVGAVLILKYAVPHVGLVKRFQRGKYFHVLGRHMLEPKKSLYLVRIAKRYLVIGVADHGINLITEISKEEAEEDKGR